MLSSCPVELPQRFGWLKSGRFLRLLSALVAFAVLAGILYNAVMIDRVPPTCTLQVSSMAGNDLAMTMTSINVTFSEEVRRDTAERAFSMTETVTGKPAVEGTFHWEGRKLIFTPSAKLPVSTGFHVHIAPGIEDVSGNAQGGTQDIDFTTVGPPKVASVVPAPDTGSVPIDAPVQITFDRIMDTHTVIEGLTLKPDITYQASWSGLVLTLAPIRPMEYGTTYTVSIGDPAVDTDGTKLPLYTMSFKTVGLGLQVKSLVPAPNVNGASIRSQIAVTFDAPIDPTSIAGAIAMTPPVSGSIQAISLPNDSSPSSLATATSAGAGPNVLVFTPDNSLKPDTTYSVTLSSTVKRTDGQVAEGQTWRFITGNPAANALNQIAFISHVSGVDNVWLMNPDGSNQREITSELVPVSGYDISGDGTTIAYGAGGVVKTMALSGDNLATLTPGGDFEYAPTFTPDGTGLIVGRRDGKGVDLGYWRYPLVTGADIKQVAPDGAPGPGSVALPADGLTGLPGMSSWAPRAALTPDGKTMLFARGADDEIEVVDTSGVNKPITLSLRGNSRPVWVQSDGSFYLTASSDQGATWACWRVTPAGSATECGAATTDVASSGGGLALIVKAGDGSYHLAYAAVAGGLSTPLTSDPSFSEAAPSFSPNGSAIAFGRVSSQSPGVSAGIWTIDTDGTGLTILTTDGASPRWIP